MLNYSALVNCAPYVSQNLSIPTHSQMQTSNISWLAFNESEQDALAKSDVDAARKAGMCPLYNLNFFCNMRFFRCRSVIRSNNNNWTYVDGMCKSDCLKVPLGASGLCQNVDPAASCSWADPPPNCVPFDNDSEHDNSTSSVVLAAVLGSLGGFLLLSLLFGYLKNQYWKSKLQKEDCDFVDEVKEKMATEKSAAERQKQGEKYANLDDAASDVPAASGRRLTTAQDARKALAAREAANGNQPIEMANVGMNG